ncbi:MAG: orotidine-5'-phosphate decarboxylase [Gammaproteobacteria bacterium]|nr:orotidine-5'-phosphate decarboxylase [Gammaproteobacteria bacterium]
MKYSKNIIVALDFLDQDTTKEFIKNISPDLFRVKIGKALFTSAGPDLVKYIQDQNFEVFLDLKFHDIPNTVYHACIAVAKLQTWMLTVHTMGGLEMLTAAREGLAAGAINNSYVKPLLVGVTVLTSLDNAALVKIGINHSIDKQVYHLADLALEANLDGIVCSAQEVKTLKNKYGTSLKFITPGIIIDHQIQGSTDQKRVMLPKEAIQAGSDYLVIGRAITGANNPKKILEDIIQNSFT